MVYGFLYTIKDESVVLLRTNQFSYVVGANIRAVLLEARPLMLVTCVYPKVPKKFVVYINTVSM